MTHSYVARICKNFALPFVSYPVPAAAFFQYRNLRYKMGGIFNEVAKG